MQVSNSIFLIYYRSDSHFKLLLCSLLKKKNLASEYKIENRYPEKSTFSTSEITLPMQTLTFKKVILPFYRCMYDRILTN